MEGAFPAKSFILQLMMLGWRLTTREEQNLPFLGSYFTRIIAFTYNHRTKQYKDSDLYCEWRGHLIEGLLQHHHGMGSSCSISNCLIIFWQPHNCRSMNASVICPGVYTYDSCIYNSTGHLILPMETHLHDQNLTDHITPTVGWI